MAKVESVGANKVKIEIGISKEEFAAAMQQAYLKNRGNFNIQGFRKGKAPRPVIESHYGEGIFYEEAFEIAFPESYTKAVDELEIVPVSRPELDVTNIGKDGVSYTAEVFVKPEVRLGEYKGVKVKEVKSEVADQQVDAEIAQAAERNARWVDVDRAAQEKDKVIMDYSGSVDGVKFEGGTAENQALELGSHSFIEGFEEQIVGMSKDDEKDISVKFPEDYRATELAGKDAVFHIVLHDVKTKEMPELNDDFAQDVSEFDTFAEYRADVCKKLQEKADHQAKHELENAVLEEVVKATQIDLPDCMIENQIDHQMQQIEYSLMYQGMKLADYLAMSGTKMEDLRAQYRDDAEKSVRSQLTVEAIMLAEGIEATEEQVKEEIAARAERAKKDADEYAKTLKEEQLSYIKENLAYDNTVRFLVENAIISGSKKKVKKDKAEEENTSAE